MPVPANAQLRAIPQGQEREEDQGGEGQPEKGDLQRGKARGRKGADKEADDAPADACDQHTDGGF